MSTTNTYYAKNEFDAVAESFETAHFKKGDKFKLVSENTVDDREYVKLKGYSYSTKNTEVLHIWKGLLESYFTKDKKE